MLRVTAEHIITQDDIDAGFVENTAIATGDSPSGTDDVTDTSDTGTDVAGDPITDPEGIETPDGNGDTNGDPTDDPTVTILEQNPAIALVKEADIDLDPNGNCLVIEVGGTIDYIFTVTNEGNVSLSSVDVTDILVDPITFVSGDTDGDNELDVDETWIFNGSLIVDQADIDAGQIVNTATVTASDPSGDEVSDISGATIGDDEPTVTPICQDPAIAIVKTGVFNDEDGDGLAQVGETITYTFTVTNEGNVDISNVVITDDLIPDIIFVSGDTDGDGELDVDETWIFTGTYTINQDDIDLGVVFNQAIATCLLYTSPSPRDQRGSRMPSSA